MSKRVIEVQRGEAWERVELRDLRVGDRFRMWEREDKQDCYLGCFLADGVPTVNTEGVWGIVAIDEGKET